MSRQVILIAVAAVIALVVGILVGYFLHVKPKERELTLVARPNVAAPNVTILFETSELISKSELIEKGLYARAYTWIQTIRGYVKVSPDGKYVIVGTQKYELYVFDAKSGRLVKRLSYGVGEVPVTIEFSPDGKYMLVGLSSKVGKVICYEVEPWKEVWSIELAKFVKGPSNATPATIFKSPWKGVIPRYITFSPDGHAVYIAVYERYIKPSTQGYKYAQVKVDLAKIYTEIKRKYGTYIIKMWTSITWGRLLAVDARTGKVLWVWPKNETVDVSIPIVVTSPDGKYVAVASFYGYAPTKPDVYHGGKVWVLDAKTGSVIYTFSPPPLVPYLNRTTIWNGLAFSKDGKYLIVVTGDARLYIIDHVKSVKERRPVIVKVMSFCKPIPDYVILIPKRGNTSKVVLGYKYTFGGLAGVADRYVIVYTSATYSTVYTPGYERRPYRDHPNASKIFIVDLRTGKVVYTDVFSGKLMYGKVTPFVISGCYLVGAIGNNWLTGDASVAGVYIWYICDTPRFITRFLTVTRGLGVPLDVDVHDNVVYVLTGPIDVTPSPMERANIIGQYKLIALKIS